VRPHLVEREAKVNAGTSVRPGHAFSRLPVHPPAAGVVQTKLAVNKPGDEYEQEADRVAEQVMRTPGQSAVRGASPRIQRLAGEPAGQVGGAPASVNEALATPGRPLEPTLRQDMEERFGHDFSQVRVHSGLTAEQSARDVNAYAYTVGQDIIFGAGRFAPGTVEGQRLLAHELTHVVQQSGGAPSIQRFASCTTARMSLEECPSRDPGEQRESRVGTSILLYIEAPEPGYIITNFEIGKGKLKSSAKLEPHWSEMIAKVTEPNSEWEILGFSDCHGDELQNRAVRQQRADAVRAALPPAVGPHIAGVSGAALSDCMTDNGNPTARQWNRSVLIMPVRRELSDEGENVEGERPVPRPANQSTSDCGAKEKKEIAQAKPIADDMVRTALLYIRERQNPDVKRLLRKYFNDDSDSTFEAVHDGLLETMKGLNAGSVTFECESKGDWFYDHFCGNDGSTVAYVRSLFGLNVHLCESAFGDSDLELATTIVHEFSHFFDFTDDEEYCSRITGCSSSLSTADAIDNAESYAAFAWELYLL
jgi:uncharacterized protein DUF4157/lysine-specific metallo-endopeptidase family protein